MKTIKGYLAVLVVIALIGGNGVRYLLSHQFDTVSSMSQAHAVALLWQKDYIGISANVKQYLISTDLILGSGETYLASGVVKKGSLIVKEIERIVSSNNLLESTEGLTNSAVDIRRVNEYIMQAARGDLKDRNRVLENLLVQYDPIAVRVSQVLQTLSSSIEAAIQQSAYELSKAEESMKSDALLIQLGFTILVIMSWYWASVTIIRPLQRLRNESLKAEQGGSFVGVEDGPVEIRELSQSFSSMAETLSFQAGHDPLTKLNNRRAFYRAVKEFVHEAEEGQESHVLCFIDLDHFKAINDSCGHAAGDEVLVSIAQLLKAHIGAKDIIARLGGDEFAILLHSCPVPKALDKADKIREAIGGYKYINKSRVYQIGASIGITEVDNVREASVEDILAAADIACMQAKVSGRNTVMKFDACSDILKQKRQDAVSVGQIKSALRRISTSISMSDITEKRSMV